MKTHWRVLDEVVISCGGAMAKICILQGRKKLAPPTNLDLPIWYPNGHGINPRKVSDLQTMIPFLPLSCRDFYRSSANYPVAGDFDSDDIS